MCDSALRRHKWLSRVSGEMRRPPSCGPTIPMLPVVFRRRERGETRCFFRCRLLLLTFQSPLLFLLRWSSADIYCIQEPGPWFHKAASKEDKWWRMLERNLLTIVTSISCKHCGKQPRPFNYKTLFVKITAPSYQCKLSKSLHPLFCWIICCQWWWNAGIIMPSSGGGPANGTEARPDFSKVNFEFVSFLSDILSWNAMRQFPAGNMYYIYCSEIIFVPYYPE